MSRTPDVHIPSLQKKAESYNLMEPGPGTPWEDRGNLGIGKALWQTCTLSLQNVPLLLNQMRRIETTGDTWGFAAACAGVWSVSMLVHTFIYYCWLLLLEAQTRGTADAVTVNTNMVLYGGVALSVMAGLMVLLLLKLGASLFHRLASGEEAFSRVPPVLTFNVMAYCLGPSVLALIPLAGPPLAVAYMLYATVRGTRTRLHVSRSGAVVCSIITYAAVLGIVAVAWFVGTFTWSRSMPPTTEVGPRVIIRQR